MRTKAEPGEPRLQSRSQEEERQVEAEVRWRWARHAPPNSLESMARSVVGLALEGWIFLHRFFGEFNELTGILTANHRQSLKSFRYRSSEGCASFQPENLRKGP